MRMSVCKAFVWRSWRTMHVVLHRHVDRWSLADVFLQKTYPRTENSARRQPRIFSRTSIIDVRDDQALEEALAWGLCLWFNTKSLGPQFEDSKITSRSHEPVRKNVERKYCLGSRNQPGSICNLGQRMVRSGRRMTWMMHVRAQAQVFWELYWVFALI